MEMRRDIRFSRAILQPLDVLGVDRFTLDGVILQAQYKTRALKQWAVGRAFNLLIKKRFDEKGIAFGTHRVAMAGSHAAITPIGLPEVRADM
jgi:small-conductance mechanosensitive channel